MYLANDNWHRNSTWTQYQWLTPHNEVRSSTRAFRGIAPCENYAIMRCTLNGSMKQSIWMACLYLDHEEVMLCCRTTLPQLWASQKSTWRQCILHSTSKSFVIIHSPKEPKLNTAAIVTRRKTDKIDVKMIHHTEHCPWSQKRTFNAIISSRHRKNKIYFWINRIFLASKRR